MAVVPPPGWPTPPAGWQPFPGWEHDPSWPPAPPDWPWWQPNKRTWSQRANLGVLGLVIAIGVALFATEVENTVRGCGSIDPTDQANYSEVTIVNDTTMPVIVDDCNGVGCDSHALPQTVQAGADYTDEAGCGETGKDMTSWRLTTPNGRVLGYIAVDSPKSQDGLRYPVSAASPNRSTPTTPVRPEQPNQSS
jgi:hypothetical protein